MTISSSDYLLQDSSTAGPYPGPDHRPHSIAELGMRQSVLEDLALKTLYLAGSISVYELSQQMRLAFELTNELFSRMRTELLCHVTGMKGNVPEIAITSQGRSRALELLSHNQYTGPAPVSLENYVTQVRRQSVRNMVVHQPSTSSAPLPTWSSTAAPCRSLAPPSTQAQPYFSMARPARESPQLPKPWPECSPRTTYGCPTRSRSTARSSLSTIR